MKLRASFMFKNPLTGNGLIVERHHGLTDDEITNLLRSALSKEKDNFVSFTVESYFDSHDKK